MRIIDYFRDDRQLHWQQQIGGYEWRAAKYLAKILQEGSFHDLLGRGTLYLLTEGDDLVSFLTLTERDCIDAPELHPWIGFVHTAPEHRGHRYAGLLLEHAMRRAGENGERQVYICTDHVGLYEKYGFKYLDNRVSIYGEDSRVLVQQTERPQVRVMSLTDAGFHTFSLDGFIRHQIVKRCWRNTSVGWRLMPVVFTEDWDADRLRAEAAELLEMHAEGIPVFVAKAGDTVVGFAALGGRLGSCGQYMELSSLQVTEPWRGCGVGRQLFRMACDAARAAGAQKLYISAHSSEESQAAYRAMGCVHAQECDPAHAASEPFDVQMEYDLMQPVFCGKRRKADHK